MVWKYSITYYKSKRLNISASRFVEKYCPAAKLFEFIAKTTALNRISRKWHTTHLGLQSELVGLPASNIIIRIVDAATSQKHNGYIILRLIFKIIWKLCSNVNIYIIFNKHTERFEIVFHAIYFWSLHSSY